MILKKSNYKKLAVLLAITSIMSMSIISCGSTENSKPDTDTASEQQSEPSENVIVSETNEPLSEDEKVIVFTYSGDKYYHIDRKCSHDEKDEAMPLLEKAAINCDYLPCPKCVGNTEDNNDNK